MSLHQHVLHHSEIVQVREVRCRPEHCGRGGAETVSAATVILPVAGLFLVHLDRGERVVAAPGQAVLLNAGQPYHVSHPVAGGDDCLALSFAPEVLLEAADRSDPRCEARPEAPFGRAHRALRPQTAAAARLFWSHLGLRSTSALHADETALALLAQTLDAPAPREASGGRGAHLRRRHEERIETVQIALAANPQEKWTLAELARRVHVSPFHLLRSFRRAAGMPIHRYHLMVRLGRALDLLLDSQRDLATIAAEVGFSSHSHLTAAFRATFGRAPAALRRSARRGEIAELRNILTAGSRIAR